MIRKMIGWVSSTGDSWEIIGHQMKVKLGRCLELYPMDDWSDTVRIREEKIMSSMNEMPFWTRSTYEWDPVECSSANLHFAFRTVGRPFTRWNDSLNPVPYVAPII